MARGWNCQPLRIRLEDVGALGKQPMAGSANSVSEVELKFLLSAKSGSAVSTNPIFASGTSQAELRSVYYDTPAWDLHKQVSASESAVRRECTFRL